MPNANLILDFDGVMCDSFRERAIVAHLTYQFYKGRNSLSSIVAEDLNPENPNIKATIRLLLQKRPYLLSNEGGSKNYLEQLILLYNYGADFNSIDEFKVQRTKWRLDIVGNDYRHLFHQIENHLKDNFYEDWIELLPLFSGVGDALKQMRNYNLFVCTLAQKYRVTEVIHRYDLPISGENIFSIDYNGHEKLLKHTTKQQKLIKIQSRSGVPFEHTHYVEDDLPLAIEIKANLPSINIYIATWGYLTVNWPNSISNIGVVPLKSLDIPNQSL